LCDSDTCLAGECREAVGLVRYLVITCVATEVFHLLRIGEKEINAHDGRHGTRHINICRKDPIGLRYVANDVFLRVGGGRL
jgi:hypothetical protein